MCMTFGALELRAPVALSLRGKSTSSNTLLDCKLQTPYRCMDTLAHELLHCNNVQMCAC